MDQAESEAMNESQVIAARSALAIETRLAALQAEKDLVEALIYGLRTLQALEQGFRGVGTAVMAEICHSKAGPAEALLESPGDGVSGTPDQGASNQP